MCSEIVSRQKYVFTIQLNLSDEKIPLYIKWVEKGTDWTALTSAQVDCTEKQLGLFYWTTEI